MDETIQERLHRLANAGRKPEPKQEVKRVFEMPNKEPPAQTRGKGYLDNLLDEVDKKYNNGVIR
mgnify:CR=1 FL=1